MSFLDGQSGGYRGVWQIFRYNWHFYAAALFVDFCVAFLLGSIAQRAEYRVALYFIATATTFLVLSALLVSYYVYDRSPLLRWEWLRDVLGSGAGDWANIHAGLDQSSESLLRLFPSEHPRILDIYTPAEMTEPSIERARTSAQSAVAFEKAIPSALPLEDGECDTIFLIFVAHELRKREARVQFLRKVNRALKVGGRVVLVEHLRDWRNFLAFGPGALHFYSREQWRTLGQEVGFECPEEVGITPFVCCFVFSKRSAKDMLCG
jgi:SAM-dependent methyltransferase